MGAIEATICETATFRTIESADGHATLSGQNLDSGSVKNGGASKPKQITGYIVTI